MIWMILLALALSFDCLGVGFSYGLRHMILPWYGVIIICACSGAVLAISMLFGRWLGQFVSPGLVRFFGAGLLIGLGIYMLSKSVRELVQEEEEGRPLLQWEIARFGIIIQILKEPHRADLDRSGQISGKEAVWLGLALSLDSFGAGIGMAWMGYSPFLTSICTAISTCMCLWLGLYLGEHAGERLSSKKMKLMPGCLLIFIGLVRLLQR